MRTQDSEFMQIDGSNQAEGPSKVKERVYFPETGKSSSFTNMDTAIPVHMLVAGNIKLQEMPEIRFQLRSILLVLTNW